MPAGTKLILVDQIEPMILTIRGQKVVLDRDLAGLYGVPTKRLNEQVRRNRDRFPADFMFRLTANEAETLRSQSATLEGDKAAILRSQNATSSSSHGGRRYLPYAFTEHGAIMAATILNSPRAVEISVFVVRAFVKLREMARTHKELAGKLTELEKKVGVHDDAIRQLIEAMRQLMAPPPETQNAGRSGLGGISRNELGRGASRMYIAQVVTICDRSPLQWL